MKKRIKFKAYSIIEASLSITMIGIILIVVLSFFKYNDLQNKKEINRCKANYVRKSIEGYVATYGLLPNASDVDGIEKDGLFEGYIPYKTLGIPKSYAYDAYSKPFKIKINRNFILNEYKNHIILPIYWTGDMYDTIGLEKIHVRKTLQEAENEIKKRNDIISFHRLNQNKMQKNKFNKYIIYRKYDNIVYKNFIKHSFNLKNHKLIRYSYEFNKQNKVVLNDELSYDKLIYYNTIYEEIAWAMVDSKHKDYNKNFNVDNTYYYQTRFNIACMLNTTCFMQNEIFCNNLYIADFENECIPDDDEDNGWEGVFNEN